MQKFNYMKVKKLGSDWLIQISRRERGKLSLRKGINESDISLDSDVVLDVERPKVIISFVRIKSLYIWLEWSKNEKMAVNYL